MSLLDSFWDYSFLVRAVRIRISTLHKIDECEQLSFFNADTNQLNESIKKIKNKYGKDKIFVASDGASFINRKNEDEAPSGEP